jgi:hypothetical protein
MLAGENFEWSIAAGRSSIEERPIKFEPLQPIDSHIGYLHTGEQNNQVEDAKKTRTVPKQIVLRGADSSSTKFMGEPAAISSS